MTKTEDMFFSNPSHSLKSDGKFFLSIPPPQKKTVNKGILETFCPDDIQENNRSQDNDLDYSDALM